jgi:methionyl aminopeptidase
MILALEPFASNGKGVGSGYVEDAKRQALIYSSNGTPKTEVGKILVKKYHRLPFSLRSAVFFLNKERVSTRDLSDILSKDNFHGYKPLVEKTGGLVSQAEHTVIITTKGAKVIT